MLVAIELEPRDLAALERLALLAPGDRDPHRMAAATTQFLAAAPCVAAIGDAADPSPGLPLPPEHAGWRRYRKARALDPAALDRVSGAPLARISHHVEKIRAVAVKNAICGAGR